MYYNLLLKNVSKDNLFACFSLVEHDDPEFLVSMPYLEECQKMANYSAVSLQLCEMQETFEMGSLEVR